MTASEHVVQHQKSNDAAVSERLSSRAAASRVPNDELPAMLGRATHAQAAVNPRDNPNASFPDVPLSVEHSDRIRTEIPPAGNHEAPKGRKDEEPPLFSRGRRHIRDTSTGRPRPTFHVSFEEFASQVRLHRYHEHKVDLLRRRQESLWKSIALSLRLHRVGSGVHEGLVDISKHADKTGFVRVYQQMNDLIDVFYMHWKGHMDPLDPILEVEATSGSPLLESESFIRKLSDSSRVELLGFLNSLRSDPDYLVERIMSLSMYHLEVLTKSIRPREIPISDASPFHRPRSSQKKRFEAFSHGLENHAISFERSSSLSFLLFNIFGYCLDVCSPEYILRLKTWSSICAALLRDREQRYNAFVNQIFNVFATLSVWRAKVRLELFLMDTLQKGAFLLELPQPSPTSAFSESPLDRSLNPFGTQEAEDFFDKAVLDLFTILNDQDGGFPEGVLHLGSAILGHLDSLDDQGSVRGHIFQWLLNEFLGIAIVDPENEQMLLQCHISKEARLSILGHLWQRARISVYDIWSEFPERPVNPKLRMNVEQMINRLIQAEVPCNPYNSHRGLSKKTGEIPTEQISIPSSIVVSASDVAGAINALFPPPSSALESWDPFISSSATAFSNQYSFATTRLDKLRREILLLADLATRSANQPRLLHPCQENWTLLLVDQDGRATDSGSLFLSSSQSRTLTQELKPKDLAQAAVLELVERHRTQFGMLDSTHTGISSFHHQVCLEERFRTEFLQAQTKADSVEMLHWHQALQTLSESYPSSTLAQNDTRLLASLFQASQTSLQRRMKMSTRLENNILELRDIFDSLKDSIYQMSGRLEKLRTKMWYAVDVVNSRVYEDAKNIASALKNMAIPGSDGAFAESASTSSRGRRPPSSSSSSLLDQPREDTINILKASSEHGGPKKLADQQLELTRKWLQHNSVDNFCKGEERIHRFCMEIKMAAKKLVGETMNESPVLWASELFAKEKASFDDNNAGRTSAQMSTRAPSIISEAPSSNFQLPRLGQRGSDSVPRGHLSDSHNSPGRKSSFHSLGSGRHLQDLFGADRSSSGSSPGRAASATTTESLMSVFSQHPAYSQSGTSMSMRSRPASTYNEIDNVKIAELSIRDKAKFLDAVQHGLLCMLLSDLGCPVWSSGSETDAWLQKIYADDMIQRRLKQRLQIERLVSEPGSKNKEVKLPKDHNKARRARRSTSAAPRVDATKPKSSSGIDADALAMTSSHSESTFIPSGQYPYTQGYQDLFDKLTREIDPIRKLQALNDFKKLALAEFGLRHSTKMPTRSSPPTRPGGSLPSSRRSSFDPRATAGKPVVEPRSSPPASIPVELDERSQEPDEADVIQILKELLIKLRPKTLFRDLQYVSAFVSSDVLNKTESGRAFLHFGLAALAYKDEMCRSMVDVADKIIAKDLIKRKAPTSGMIEPSLLNIVEFWIFAAREGNAVAQRELASLYLAYPERVPIVSLPLSLSSETFKNEMVWHTSDDTKISQQKLCLAFHWMQHAANNGDEVANQKMNERKFNISIR